MRPILSILLSFLFLMQAMVSNMDLCCELPKFTNLIEHYEEHATNDNLSFYSFLNIHYGDGQDLEGHKKDKHHNNLPFHDRHQCGHAPILIAPLSDHPEIVNFYVSIQIKASPYNFSIGSEYSESPFQPPRV